jgi:DNA-binding transcriptional regulator YbjK
MVIRTNLSQNRSRVRRDELLDAAIVLFAEGGPRGITYRAVAAKAGLAPATTTYYFKSIDELIAAALDRHIENWLSVFHSITSIPLEEEIGFDDVAGLVAGIFSVRPAEVVALNISIYVAATRTPELRPKAAEAAEAFVTIAEKMLQHLGMVGADELARSLVMILAGSTLGRLSEQRTDAEVATTLYNSMRGLVAAVLLSEDEIYTKLGELGNTDSSHDI